MLVNLRTIHKPKTYEEAAELLKRPGVYPLYGGGASLIRMDRRDVEEAVDLSAIPGHSPTGLYSHTDTDEDTPVLYVDPRSSIQELVFLSQKPHSTYLRQISQLLKQEYPETLRDVMTFGDVLIECNPQSILLGYLKGIQTELLFDSLKKSMSIDSWFNLTHEERRKTIIESFACFTFAFSCAVEKVSRTPSDSAIVAAIGIIDLYNEGRQFSIVTGLADRPVRYEEGMQSQISDYRGSAEYRTEMARILSKRAIAKATELAKI